MGRSAHNSEELEGTLTTCPTDEVCRVVVHPGRYADAASVFTLNHWYRHYIGVLAEDGSRPVLSSMVGSVFANKGNRDYQQNIILQNLELTGPVGGVDFDGADGDTFFHRGGMSWLDNVRIDVDGKAILFNGNRDGSGTGFLWCTRCEIDNHMSTNMVAVTQIDLAYFSDSTLRSDAWWRRTVVVGADAVAFHNVVDERGNPLGCGDWEIVCRDGAYPELLRDPTLEWFEALVNAQDPRP